MVEPKVRFKQDNGSSYPEWIEYTVADIFEKVKTKNKDCRNNNVITNSAELGLVNQRDFFDKDIAVGGKTENYTIIKKGDFVYNPRKSSHAPMGPFNCYRLEDDGIVSPLYTCLRPKNVLNAEYLLWFFQTDKWHDYVNEHGAQNGARHDRVGMTDSIMMGIPINAPCPEEQEKIAGFLGTINELIASSEKEVEKYKELKKGCLQKMFPKDGASVPEVRFPGFTDDWEQRKLGEIYTFQYGEFNNNPDNGGAYPIYGANGIIGGYTEYNAEDSAVIGHMGAYAGYVVWAEGKHFVTYNGTIAKPSDDSTDSKFGFYLLSSKQIYRICAGSGQPFVSYADLNSIDVQIPKEKNEQQRIGAYLTNLDNLITLHQRECEKYKELKKGLLQQMFI